MGLIAARSVPHAAELQEKNNQLLMRLTHCKCGNLYNKMLDSIKCIEFFLAHAL
ncbi:hypothetical protein SAMN05428977_100737 [Nitrosomonas sp. Nm166]|nr:hypothetical protein SAMN05428977_100737 [Nitrosomonas sp. Nm166]